MCPPGWPDGAGRASRLVRAIPAQQEGRNPPGPASRLASVGARAGQERFGAGSEGPQVDARVQTRLDAMHDAVDGFVDVVATLRDGDWGLPTGCPGWTVHDVVAHVVGLEDVLTGGPEPTVDVPDLPHVTGDVARYTERHVHVRRGRRPVELVEELLLVVGRRRQQLAGDLEALAPSFLGGQQPLAQSIALRAFDIFSHEQDIRRAVGRHGHLDGPAAAACLVRTLRGLASVLPDRVVADEATLVLDVIGAQTGSLWLDLGTGEVLSSAPDDPTVSMTFAFADLVPLACGRDDAPDPARVATVTGNDAIAARVLTSLGITP